MSLHSYHASKVISRGDWPFYALVMAAMRKADTHNSALLAEAFPQIHEELLARYNAPGGALTKDEMEWVRANR